ncbi:MAG: helix-turn-helix transcriptional regulator [Oscillospiraceae bacterium]|nr:helix-turn-helix transcriptional regulator [Oscillospiraceae bacterium]MDY5736522.1 helix-turn-helix transcriptional regulator [Oscillospiraceae bacterium]
MKDMKDRVIWLIAEKRITKSKFAKALNVSPAFISQLCSGASMPSDRTIADICRVFGVSEIWLRTGAGEPFTPTSHKEEMTSLFAQLLRDRPESFRVRAITTLLKFDADGPEWAVLEKIYNSIAQEAEALKKQKPPDR